MQTWTINNLEGKEPTGTAAVVTAETVEMACWNGLLYFGVIMGAATKYYATVRKFVTEVVEVSGITSDDAEYEAARLDGVVDVVEVKHWSEVEEDPEI